MIVSALVVTKPITLIAEVRLLLMFDKFLQLFRRRKVSGIARHIYDATFPTMGHFYQSDGTPIREWFTPVPRHTTHPLVRKYRDK
jgi:hypothetical protein